MLLSSVIKETKSPTHQNIFQNSILENYFFDPPFLLAYISSININIILSKYFKGGSKW